MPPASSQVTGHSTQGNSRSEGADSYLWLCCEVPVTLWETLLPMHRTGTMTLGRQGMAGMPNLPTGGSQFHVSATQVWSSVLQAL